MRQEGVTDPRHGFLFSLFCNPTVGVVLILWLQRANGSGSSSSGPPGLFSSAIKN